jgi:hypothetical protein
MLPIQVGVLVDDNDPSDGLVGAEVLHHDDERHIGHEMDLAGQSALLRFTGHRVLYGAGCSDATSPLNCC